jgi:rod shape determining protein RodA
MINNKIAHYPRFNLYFFNICFEHDFMAGFQFSPSLFSRLALAGMLAAILADMQGEISLRDVVRVVTIAAIPMVLVFIQPDIGTTIVLVAITVGILVVAGTRPKHLLVLALTSIVLVALAFQLHVIRDYQVARLTGFLDPQNSADTTRYNREQAEIAVGAGGLFGRGYLAGTQTNLDFVPEQHTDFIFTAVGEELGFVGSVGLLGLLAIVMWRVWRTARLARDFFGMLVCTGVLAMLAFQIFENIGMTMGIMPVIGIPLPFISSGGSALLGFSLLIGILLSMDSSWLRSRRVM